MGNYSEDPQIFLSDAISNSYVGVRFQQGKPILDRELNLLGDLSSPQRLARPYIGNGVPDGSDGFRIGNLTVDNDEFDFTIGRGRCIVNGYEVELKEDTTFKRQKNYNRDGLVQPRPGETKYEVHLRVFTKEISYTEDLDLENRDDIGFETTRRLQADWEVIVGTSVLFDASMTDLFLLAEIDTGSLQVTDRRTTRLTVSKIRRDLDQLTDKTASMSQILNVNTLSVRDTLGVGFTSTSEAPSVTPTIQAAQTAANAAEAAAISLNALVKAASAEGVAAATDTMNSLNAKASQAYDAAIAAKAAALDAAVPSRTPSEVSRSATSAADQTRLAGQRAQEAATLGNQIATALSPEKATQANSIRTAATDSDAKGKAAVTAADTAKREADNLDSAVAGYNLTRTIQASAKFAVNGDSYLQGNLTTTGKLGLGTMNAPTEKLQIDGGSIFINGENTGLIVDATGAKRVGFIKYASREAGIWRASAQDFEIGRVDASVNALPGSPNAFTTDLYIQGDGKVGINTTNPGSRLTVSSSASHLQLRREATETTGGSQMFLELFQDDSNPA